PHFIGVPEWVIRRVNDDLWVIVSVGSAMGADQTAGAVVLRRPGPQIEPRRRHRAGYDSDPGLVAQDRAVLAEEDGVGQAVADAGDRHAGVAVKRAVDPGRLIAVGWNRLGHFEVVAERQVPAPGLMHAGVGDIVRVGEEDAWRERHAMPDVGARLLHFEAVA